MNSIHRNDRQQKISSIDSWLPHKQTKKPITSRCLIPLCTNVNTVHSTQFLLILPNQILWVSQKADILPKFSERFSSG